MNGPHRVVLDLHLDGPDRCVFHSHGNEFHKRGFCFKNDDAFALIDQRADVIDQRAEVIDPRADVIDPRER